jgi:hypothetical protein
MSEQTGALTPCSPDADLPHERVFMTETGLFPRQISKAILPGTETCRDRQVFCLSGFRGPRRRFRRIIDQIADQMMFVNAVTGQRQRITALQTKRCGIDQAAGPAA